MYVLTARAFVQTTWFSQHNYPRTADPDPISDATELHEHDPNSLHSLQHHEADDGKHNMLAADQDDEQLSHISQSKAAWSDSDEHKGLSHLRDDNQDYDRGNEGLYDFGEDFQPLTNQNDSCRFVEQEYHLYQHISLVNPSYPERATSSSRAGSKSALQHHLKSALSTAKEILNYSWNMFLRNAYLITVIVVYIASLDEVSVFNAGYLIFMVLFLGFPVLREKYWVILPMYCTGVILTNYIWGFPSVHGASKTVIELLGLDDSIHNHVWQRLRWHIAALFFSIVQLLAYRLLPSTRCARVKSRRTIPSRYSKTPHPRQTVSMLQPQDIDDDYVIFTPPIESKLTRSTPSNTESLFASQEDTKAKDDIENSSPHEKFDQPASTQKRKSRLLRTWLKSTEAWISDGILQFWPVFVSLALLLSGMLGHVTMMRLGFLSLLALVLLLFELGQHSILRKCWYIVLLYSGVVLVASYTYQFAPLQPYLNRTFGEDLIGTCLFQSISIICDDL